MSKYLSAIKTELEVTFISYFSELTDENTFYSREDKIMNFLVGMKGDFGCMFTLNTITHKSLRPEPKSRYHWQYVFSAIFFIAYDQAEVDYNVEEKAEAIMEKIQKIFDNEIVGAPGSRGLNSADFKSSKFNVIAISKAEAITLDDKPVYAIPFVIEVLDG